jgi:hypothetical protein
MKLEAAGPGGGPGTLKVPGPTIVRGLWSNQWNSHSLNCDWERVFRGALFTEFSISTAVLVVLVCMLPRLSQAQEPAATPSAPAERASETRAAAIDSSSQTTALQTPSSTKTESPTREKSPFRNSDRTYTKENSEIEDTLVGLRALCGLLISRIPTFFADVCFVNPCKRTIAAAAHPPIFGTI